MASFAPGPRWSQRGPGGAGQVRGWALSWSRMRAGWLGWGWVLGSAPRGWCRAAPGPALTPSPCPQVESSEASKDTASVPKCHPPCQEAGSTEQVPNGDAETDGDSGTTPKGRQQPAEDETDSLADGEPGRALENGRCTPKDGLDPQADEGELAPPAPQKARGRGKVSEKSKTSAFRARRDRRPGPVHRRGALAGLTRAVGNGAARSPRHREGARPPGPAAPSPSCPRSQPGEASGWVSPCSASFLLTQRHGPPRARLCQQRAACTRPLPGSRVGEGVCAHACVCAGVRVHALSAQGLAACPEPFALLGASRQTPACGHTRGSARCGWHDSRAGEQMASWCVGGWG